ncbi:hypothetical protein [Nitrososphaera sp. AFS]|jgi:hypothetical protein|uniref:hypothetical protein n=1 Tax=Nitrososphaera sp. AFS TaxID=2301191 RepID=UPI001392376A|nr:hypothetical protein [Nitrososphaera sp. AFS]NAL77697.1 hypothetical protein [Nitrososphaera sp. AFS]
MVGHNKYARQSRLQKKKIQTIESSYIHKTKADVVEDWFVERFVDKLRKVSVVVQQTHIPHILYRTTIEGNEDALDEEVCLMSEKYIIVIRYAYGGFIPSKFQKIKIYTLDKFARMIAQDRNTNLLVECLRNLEE